MPHKQTRKRKFNDGDLYHNLPPSANARPLPVGKDAGKPPKTGSKRRKVATAEYDDTPKAFARLMQFQKTGKRPHGLDDGQGSRKQRKGKNVEQIEPRRPDQVANIKETLKIKPGERMAEFAARVNQSLPITGLTKKGKKIDGVRDRVTRLQKKITKRQDAWRKEDAALREREQERLDEEEERAADQQDPAVYWAEVDGAGKKSKRKRRLGGDGGAELDDPWAGLVAKRADRPAGVYDVAKQPPTFARVPKAKLFNTDQSVRGRVEQEALQSARDEVIQRYRAVMDAKRK